MGWSQSQNAWAGTSGALQSRDVLVELSHLFFWSDCQIDVIDDICIIFTTIST